MRPATIVKMTRLRSGRLFRRGSRGVDVFFGRDTEVALRRGTTLLRPRARRVTLVSSLCGSFAGEWFSSANIFSGASAPRRWLVGIRCRGTICGCDHADDEPVRQSEWRPTAGFSPVDSPTLPECNESVTLDTWEKPGQTSTDAVAPASWSLVGRHGGPGNQYRSSTRKMWDATSTGSSSPSSLPSICTRTYPSL